MALFPCNIGSGGGSLSNATISGLQTGATSTTLSITMPSDGLIVGCAISSDAPSVSLNGSAITPDSVWYSGGTYIYVWVFKAPKNSTVTFTRTRYYTIT